MQIRDMFLKNIDRDLQGVIIVGQDENANVKQELEAIYFGPETG